MQNCHGTVAGVGKKVDLGKEVEVGKGVDIGKKVEVVKGLDVGKEVEVVGLVKMVKKVGVVDLIVELRFLVVVDLRLMRLEQEMRLTREIHLKQEWLPVNLDIPSLLWLVHGRSTLVSLLG